MKKLIAILAILFLLTSAFPFVGNVLAFQKNFTATISPANVYAGQSNDYELTIVNVARKSGNKLGSALVNIPNDFGVSDTAISVVSEPSGKIWNAFFDLAQIRITADTSADCIKPGESIIVSFSATVSTASNLNWDIQAYTNPAWSGDLFALEGTSPSTTVWLGFEVAFGYSNQDESAIPEDSKIGSYTQFGVSEDILAGDSYNTTAPASDWVDAGSSKVSYQTYVESDTERWALSPSPDNLDVDSATTTLSESGYFHQYLLTFGYTVTDGSPSNPDAYYKQFNMDKTVTAEQVTPDKDWVDAGTAVEYDNPIADANDFTWAIAGGATPKATVVYSVDSASLVNPVYVLQSPVGLVFPPGFDPGTVEIASGTYEDLDLFSLGDVIGPYFTVEIENIDQLTGIVTIGIHYSPDGLTLEQEQNLRLYMSDPVDLDGDGTVNGNDVNILQSAIHDHLDASAYPQYDINGDGVIDNTDLKIVKDFANGGLVVPSSSGGQWRLPWLDITTWVDTANNIIYGETDHFSGFGIRAR